MLSLKKVSLTVVTLGAGLVLGGGCVAPSPDERLGTKADEHVIESPWQGDDAAEKAEEAGEEAAKETKETGEEAAEKAEEVKDEAAEEAEKRGEEAAEEAEEVKDEAAEEAEDRAEEAQEGQSGQELRADDPRGRRFDRHRDHRLGRDRDRRFDRDHRRDRFHRARVCNVRDDFHCERGHRGWRWAWVSAPSADRHGRWDHRDRRDGARCCVRVRDHRHR